MFKSYFKTALRFLLKNKTFSFINIFGLAAGTLCCLYILLYVQSQYSYDLHHKNAKDIYRVTTTMVLTGDKHTGSTISPPIVPAIKNDFAEVDEYTRVVPTLGVSEHLLTYGEKSIYEKDAFLVDSTFFDVFSYHFTAGIAATAFRETKSIVLLHSVAVKLFGREDPIGKVITMTDLNGKNSFKVTGVVDQSLGKTHLAANIFIRMSRGGYGDDVLKNGSWVGNNFAYSYIRLKPGTNPAALEKKLPAFFEKHGGDQLKGSGVTKVLNLEAVTKIHTTPGFEHEPTNIVSTSFLYVLILIAVLIQVIACINFMNLSTARASKRAKEVGIRKVVGAGRYSLIVQFLGESFLLTVIGVLITLPLLAFLLPHLNSFTHADIRFASVWTYQVLATTVAIVLITGLLAGSYPAFYLSAFKAIKVIKGNFTSHISAAGLRRSLVVFQFALSIVMITGIIVIYSQLNYIRNKDLGFDKSRQLIFTFHTDDTRSKMQVFASDLKQLAEVKAVSMADNYPGAATYHDWSVYLAGGNDATGIDQQNLSTDENFVDAMGMKIIGGRNFIRGDSSKVLINETLAKRLGLNLQTAAGTKLFTSDTRKYIIAGVVKDFNYKSLRDDMSPFMLLYEPKRDDINEVIINANSDNYASLLHKIQSLWHKDLPATPFEYIFLNDEVQKQYETEITMSQIINAFTLMAIIISCLGLFGLAAFSAEQRNKEIGVRKVLGASTGGIVQLLSKDFLELVVVSFIIATPVAWWGMSNWLQAFAYRITISWWMFGLAGALALFIALATVSVQALKAAIANPVKSLRSE